MTAPKEHENALWPSLQDLASTDYKGALGLFLNDLERLIQKAASQIAPGKSVGMGMAVNMPNLLSEEEHGELQIAISGILMSLVPQVMHKVMLEAVTSLSRFRGGKENFTNAELSYLLSYLLGVANEALLIASITHLKMAEHGWPLALAALESLKTARKLSNEQSAPLEIERSLEQMEKEIHQCFQVSSKISERRLQGITREIHRLSATLHRSEDNNDNPQK